MSEGARLDPRDVARALGGEARGQQVSAPSPGHSKRDRSLSISIDDNAPGGFVVHSFVGDDALAVKDYVRERIGLDRWAPSNGHRENGYVAPKATPVTSYIYRSDNGDAYLRVVRMSDKSFRQFHIDGDQWVSGKPAGPKIPYRLPELLAAPDDPVFIVEGEKDADRLASLGLVATTNSEGAGKWTPEMSLWLVGRDVYVIPDNDAVGEAHALSIQSTLPQAIIVRLQNLRPKGDVSDWLDDGHTTDELMQIALSPPVEIPAETLSRLSPTPFTWTAPELLPKRQWLYGRHLIRKYVSTTIAPGGLGKSSLIVVEVLAMTSGRNLIGDDPTGQLRVWYWNGEDGQDENLYRIVAAASHHGLSPADFQERLWTDSGREKQIVIASDTRRGFEVNEEVVAEIIAHIIRHKIDVLIIDPFIAAHEVQENDNGAINAVVRALGRIAEFGNCAVELVHHVRKPGAGISSETDVNDARGASALIGGVRSARVLNVMSKDEAAEFEIENRLSYFRVDNGKSNLTARSETAVWRRIVSYDLQNHVPDEYGSDHIGVVEKWAVPGLFSNAPSNAAERAQAIISLGQYRYDVKAKEWGGYAIAESMGVDPTTREGKQTLEKMIDRWIETGVMQKVILPDANRIPRAFLKAENPMQGYDDDCIGEAC